MMLKVCFDSKCYFLYVIEMLVFDDVIIIFFMMFNSSNDLKELRLSDKPETSLPEKWCHNI